jgi:hypothetical protein
MQSKKYNAKNLTHMIQWMKYIQQKIQYTDFIANNPIENLDSYDVHTFLFLFCLSIYIFFSFMDRFTYLMKLQTQKCISLVAVCLYLPSFILYILVMIATLGPDHILHNSAPLCLLPSPPHYLGSCKWEKFLLRMSFLIPWPFCPPAPPPNS